MATFMSFYDPDTYTPERSIGYLIKTCNQTMTALLDRMLADEELNTSQWSAMMTIHHGEAPTCAALARGMAHDKGAMTRLIDTLEEKGFVERTRSADDRRVLHLSLTPAGRAVTFRCRDKVIDHWNRCFADWPDAEIETLIAQMQKLRCTLEDIATCP
ncbi:MAG: MarR family winged helix-turn-helix transcriptional regulator [Sphingomonas phyllosphaerae]|uniref:MarR family winged helix-turn-helix transcriptional regulator n=1 Tax=Sphingomonas phyllosphaerae TaxID=257003 RepID=UPI002FFCE401